MAAAKYHKDVRHMESSQELYVVTKVLSFFQNWAYAPSPAPGFVTTKPKPESEPKLRFGKRSQYLWLETLPYPSKPSTLY